MGRGRKPFFEVSRCERTSIVPLLETLDAVGGGAERDNALRMLLGQAWLWAPSFVQRRVTAKPSDFHDLVEDAVQHLAVVVAERRYSPKSVASEARALGWCKRVVANFVHDELRRRQRASSMPPTISSTESADAVVQTREAFQALVRGLRAEVTRATARPGRRRRLLLLDDFLRDIVSAEPNHPIPSHLRQRHSRNRRFARETFRCLKEREKLETEVLEVARALGLEESRSEGDDIERRIARASDP